MPYGVSRPGLYLRRKDPPVISINDPPGATSVFAFKKHLLDAPRIPHDHLRQKRRHADLRRKAADRERERRRAARGAAQLQEKREQQARDMRQSRRPRSAPAKRPTEATLDAALKAAEPRPVPPRPRSAPARRAPLAPRLTMNELMARQRESLSHGRSSQQHKPPHGSYMREVIREAPPVGSYEVTYPVQKTTRKGSQHMRYPTGGRAPQLSIRRKLSDYGYSRTHTNPIPRAVALAAEGPGAGAYSPPSTFGVRKSFNRRAGPGGVGAFDLRARF